MCEPSENGKVIGVILLIGVFLVFIVLPLVLIFRARGHRLLATGIWLGAMGLGVALPLLAGDEDAGAGVWVAIVIALVAGVAIAVRRRRFVLAVTSVLGAAAPAVIVIIGFFSLLAISETCLN